MLVRNAVFDGRSTSDSFDVDHDWHYSQLLNSRGRRHHLIAVELGKIAIKIRCDYDRQRRVTITLNSDYNSIEIWARYDRTQSPTGLWLKSDRRQAHAHDGHYAHIYIEMC